MKLYLVRHGETVLNKQKIHQKEETELSENGLQQVRSLVPFFRQTPIDVIFSSPLKRALQTTDIIANALNMEYQTIDVLKEIKRPSAIIGKSHIDPEVILIKKQIKENYHLPNWKHSDEENFIELKTRLHELQNWLTIQPYHDIILVSHGMAIKMFIALIKFGATFRAQQFLDFYEKTSIVNGSITLCSYDTTWKVEYISKKL